jgi:hypothetical protein
MQKLCVYCEVRNESICVSVDRREVCRTMAQTISRRPFTAQTRIRYQARICKICGDRIGAGTGFSPSTSVSPVSIIPPMLHTHSFIYHRRCIMFLSQYFSFPCQYNSTNAPYSSSSTCFSFQKDKRAKCGNLPKSNTLSEIGGIG